MIMFTWNFFHDNCFYQLTVAVLSLACKIQIPIMCYFT